MSTGAVKPFVDYSGNTGGDTGRTNAPSILPYANGEKVEQTVINRSPENLRQRTENVRDILDDTQYLRDADRGGFALGGPASVTWPGSTTAAASGTPTLTDNLYLIPFLTSGFAQTPPVPPVASKYGTLTLNRVGPAAGLIVTSNRRSYAGGDKINVTVVLGGAASAVLADAGAGERSIVLTVTGSTTMTAAIALLNAVTAAPSAAQLVTATLAGGAAGSDVFVTSQAKQYMVGNIDAEAHTITPAALTTFFGTAGNRLAEGDTLCIQYASVVEASPATGGRRQSLPENSNTTIPAGSLFNSRVNPEKLVNAIPIAKVISNMLIFIGGFAIAPGASATVTTGSVATTTALGTVKLLHAALTPTTPAVLSDGSRDAASGVMALDSSKRAAVTSTTGDAVTGTSGAGNGRGLVGLGNGTGLGIEGFGGPTNGIGIKGNGGGSTGVGVDAAGGSNGTALRGTATGTGDGIQATAADTGAAARLTGGLGTVLKNTAAGAGAALSVYSDVASYKPSLVAMTPNNYPRALIDHRGFRMGQVTEFYEGWTGSLGSLAATSITPCPDDPKWSSFVTGAGTLTQSFFTLDDALISCIVSVTGTTTGQTNYIGTTRPNIFLPAYTNRCPMVFEFILAPSINNSIHCAGLTAFAGDLLSAASTVFFFSQNGFANWQCGISSGGVGNTYDTGVARTGNVTGDILRIEILAGVVTFIVNGNYASAVTRTNEYLVSTAYCIGYSSRHNGQVGAGAYGPVRVCWANKENPPNM